MFDVQNLLVFRVSGLLGLKLNGVDTWCFAFGWMVVFRRCGQPVEIHGVSVRFWLCVLNISLT